MGFVGGISLVVKQVISFEKDEFKNILKNYLLDKGFENISSIKITVGNNSSDLITGNGYVGVKLEIETIKEESI